MSFLLDGFTIVTGSKDGSLKTYDIRSGIKFTSELIGHNS